MYPARVARCAFCGAFNGVRPVEGHEHTVLSSTSRGIARPKHHPTGVRPLDAALSRGVVWETSTIVAGVTSSGKSTLTLQGLAGLVRLHHRRGLYVCAEETRGRVIGRARRVGAAVEGLDVMQVAPGELDRMHRARAGYDVVVIDSLQAFAVPLPEILRRPSARPTTWFFISQLNKAGELVGSTEAQHACDALLFVELGDGTGERWVRTFKNRDGDADGKRFPFMLTGRGAETPPKRTRRASVEA